MARGLGRRSSFKDLLVFGGGGPIDNDLRFPDECVRHKMVDMVGDLALAGCDLVGRFVAFRSGHRLNAELVRTLVTLGDDSQDTVKRWRINCRKRKTTEVQCSRHTPCAVIYGRHTECAYYNCGSLLIYSSQEIQEAR